MTSPQPDPARPGIETSVDPGNTPPAEDSMSGAAPAQQPNVGPVSGNRTPMVITLAILGVIVLSVMGLMLASLA